MSLAIKAARGRAGVAPGRPMGDPGLLSFLGTVAKGVVGGAVGLATGGLPGAVSGVRQATARRSSPGALQGPIGFAGPGGAGVSLPRAGGRMPITGPSSNGRNGSGGCDPGFHPNKSSYFLRDGTFVPKGSRCVRNRRRNAMNPRALRRSIQRIDAAKSWQGKLAEIGTKTWTPGGRRRDKC